MSTKIVKNSLERGDYFKLSFNHSRRTVTIRKYLPYTTYLKMRTYPMDRQEFESAMRFWTYVDWSNFLKTDEYYIVK